MASQSDLYSLARAQGLSDSAAKIAAAVAMAESDGNQNAHNTNAATGDDSYGYWQINMLGKLGPDRRKKYGLTSNEQLFDPQTNARVMKGESFNGTNWFAWSTFKSGAYLKFMGNPVTDQTSDPNWLSKIGSAIAAPVTSPIDSAKGAIELAGKAAVWVSNSQNWIRVGYVAGGGVLVIAGLVMVLQSTGAGRAVKKTVKTAASVTPPGRAAKVATVASAAKGSK